MGRAAGAQVSDSGRLRSQEAPAPYRHHAASWHMAGGEMTSLPRREQVPVEQTWDLSDLYATEAGWTDDYQRASDGIAAVTSYQGRLGTGAATLLACLQARDALRERLERVAAYAQLHLSTDGTSPHNQARAAQIRTLAATAE